MTRIDPYLEALGITALWERRTLTDDGHAAPVGSVAADAATAATADDPFAPSRSEPTEVTRDADHSIGRADSPDVRTPTSTPANLPQPSTPRDAIPLFELGFDALSERVHACMQCRLCETRTQAVFGVGDRQADWLFVGEGPGANEDEQGEPFVGQAGKLLDNMLLALGLNRESGVFIANVVKCRPPGNRDPMPDEVAACEAYLQQQIALIKPRIIVALGRFAAQTLLKREANIGALRGTVHRYEGVPVIATYHPAYLLRTLTDKAKAWQDLCLARSTFADSADVVAAVSAAPANLPDL